MLAKKTCIACSQNQVQIASSFTISGTTAAVSVCYLGFALMYVLLKDLDPNGADFLLPQGNTDYLPFQSQNEKCTYVLKCCNGLNLLHASSTLRLGKISFKSICWFSYKIIDCRNASKNIWCQRQQVNHFCLSKAYRNISYTHSPNTCLKLLRYPSLNDSPHLLVTHFPFLWLKRNSVSQVLLQQGITSL